MRGCIPLGRFTIFGARVHLHWSALVAAGLLVGAMARQPVHAVLLVTSYFGLILLHEAGHAVLARHFGYRPGNIYLTFIHGLCEFDSPDNRKDLAMIAWGGVLAQATVAIPLILLSQITLLGSNSYFGVLVSVFGYLSVMVIFLNLSPVRGLDGAHAWQLIPILAREYRKRRSAKQAATSTIRRIK
jgi:Zn-dependent protease